MPMTASYAQTEPARAAIDLLEGPALLEFGSPDCGYCRAAQGILAEAMADYPQVNHMKIEDGRGRPLGRSFRVKLWPSLIFLKDGREVSRLVRPDNVQQIRDALAQLG